MTNSSIPMYLISGELSVHTLVKSLLDQPWHERCVIVPDYMPPYPQKNTHPEVQVQYGERFLRYSVGPKQGFFWDLYGEDFQTIELAVLALSQAPYPGPWPHPIPPRRRTHEAEKAPEVSEAQASDEEEASIREAQTTHQP